MERVSDSDRNAAIRAVDAALAQGRIVQADRDHRVAQVRGAQTPAELQMITHDLAYREQPEQPQQTWPTYEPPPPVSYGPPQQSPTTVTSFEVTRLFGARRRSGAGCLAVPFVFVLLFAGGTIFSILNAVGGSDETNGFDYEFERPPPIEVPDFEDLRPTPPLLYTDSGFARMVSAVRRATGSTEAFSAVIYPQRASLEVPAQTGAKRALTYTYDGRLSEPRLGQSRYERFDLGVVDPGVMIKLVQKARRTLVEDPTTWYVVIRKPGVDDGAWFSVYATNAYGESGHLTATLDGRVVNRYVSE